ncbi:hypothetical protein [Paenibacillus wynnii]|uniref:hypothetical protein n=1 Tax=Paenibacillus wynnii TaxID=268407 RepID=UPI0026C7F89D
MNRVLVLGSAGSGKSTLSQQLGEIFKLPVIHLDKYYWKPIGNLPRMKNGTNGSNILQCKNIGSSMEITQELWIKDLRERI